MTGPIRTAVVTDSTAYLPEAFAERHHVRVVPLHVLVDGRSALDGVELGPDELAAALADRRTVTTSRPSPEEFAGNYRELLAAGHDAVVSVHLSRELSGTWDVARVAAGEANAECGAERVRVVDSRSAVMGLGFAVLAAAAEAEAGAAAERVERAAVATAARTRTLFCVPTLEYLRRGGRIGMAAALVGGALAVRPLLHVDDGRIVMLEKVRTTSRAMARLVDLAVQACTGGPADLAVHHLGNPELAAGLAARLEERVPSASGCLISEVGAVIGAHTGPGVLGVVVLPGGLAGP